LEGLSLVGVLSFLLALGPAAPAGQNPSPAQGQDQKPKPRAKKVWTEEDMVILRKPWDLHQIAQEKKAEQESAAKAAQEPAKKPAPAKASESAPEKAPTESESQIPHNVEPLEKGIAQLTREVADIEQQLRQLDDAALNGLEEERATVDEKRKELTRKLGKAQARLKQLREELQSLNPSRPPEAPPN